MEILKQPEYSQVIRAKTSADLKRIHEPQANIALLDRPVDATFQRECEEAAALCPPLQMGITLLKSRFAQGLTAFATMLEMKHGFQSQRLFDDVRTLLEILAEVDSSSKFRLRLDINMAENCRQFHADYNELRLLCVYVGRGTQWLLEQDVMRPAIGLPVPLSDLPPQRIQEVSGFSIALLKGNRYPGIQGRGLIHKSPPHAGGPRVLVAIDPAPLSSGS